MLVSMKAQASSLQSSQNDSGRLANKESVTPARDLHRYCFACGVSNTQGLRLHFEVDEEGVAQTVWQPSPRFENYPGACPWRVVATLLDGAMVHTLFERGIKGGTAELRSGI